MTAETRVPFALSNVHLSVEARLDAVDYARRTDYVPSDFALEMVNFIKLVNGGEGEENKTPAVHYRALDTLVSGKRRIANMCFRGFAKTALFGEYLLLYLAVYGRLPAFGEISLALYVSDSIENGVKNMRKNLEHRWENSDFLRQYVPETRFTDVRWEFVNADGKKLICRGYGAKTGVRGTKELGTRPQLAILDDLISDEDARSDTVIASVEATIYKAIDYALHPKKNMIIWSGTPFNARDPLYKAVESGAWDVNVFPVCRTFPCDEFEFQGAWSDRFTYFYVRRQYEQAAKLGKVDTFNQELMLRIMSDEDRLIQDSDILWYSRQSVIDNRGRFNFYITTDFATSEHEKADYSVISVWAYNNQGHWLFVDGRIGRRSMDRNIDDLFELAQRWNPQSVGIEVSGQQRGFIPWIQNEMLERNIFFILATEGNAGRPGILPVTNKLQRFNLVVPMMKSHRVFFPSEMRGEFILVEAMEELRLVSPGGMKSKHDDFLDTMSMLSALKPWKPSESAELHRQENDLWGLDPEEDADSALGSYIC